MKVSAQVTIYIFIALATLDVCSVNLISRPRSLKIPQAMSSSGPARRSRTRTMRSQDRADGQSRVLASTVSATRTLQIP
jgi:hypothetical protein